MNKAPSCDSLCPHHRKADVANPLSINSTLPSVCERKVENPNWVITFNCMDYLDFAFRVNMLKRI